MAFNFDQIKNRAKSLDAQNTSVDRSLTPTAPKVTAPTVAPTPQAGPTMSPWNVPVVSPGTKRAKEEERKAIVQNKWYESYNLTLPGGIGKAYARSNPEIAQNAVDETNAFIERAGSSGLAGRGLGTLEGMIPSTLNQLERTLGQPLNRDPITTPIAEDWNSSPGKIWQTVKEQASNPFNQGLLGGTAIQYGLTGGVGIERAILSEAGKATAKTALGRGASTVGKVAGANAVGGLPINTVMSMDETSMMEGATGGDFAKSMAINTALDIVLGGAIEGISGMARLRRYSKAKQDEVIEKVAEQLQLPVAEVKLLTGPVQGQAGFFGSATGLSKNINDADVRQLPAPADAPVKTSNATTKPLAKKVDSDFYTNPGGQTAKDIQTADIKGLPEPKAETKSRENVFAYVDKPGVDKVKAKSDAYRAIKEATGIKDGEGNKVLTEALRKIDTNEKDGWDTPEFWNDIMDVMKKQEHSKVDPEETFPGLKKEIRETKIRISDDLKQMVDFNDLRKKSMGKVTLSKNGRPIDELYGEWSEMHPGLFPDSITHPTAQLEKILEVSDSLKPTTKTIGDVMSDDDLWDGPLTQVWKAINDYRRTVKEDVSYGGAKGQKEVPTTATRGELSGNVNPRKLPTEAKPKKELPKRLPKKEVDIYAGAKGQKEVPKTVVRSEMAGNTPKSAVQPPKSESQPVAPPKKETPKTEPKMEVKNAESKRDTVPTKARKLDPKTERVLEKLNSRLRERGEEGDRFYEAVKHPRQKEIDVLADLFKAKVVTVKPLKETADTFHGVFVDDTIVINLSKTSNPAHVIFGHEVLHQVRAKHSAEYDRFAEVFLKSLDESKVKRYKESLEQAEGKMTDDAMLEEMIADFSGEMFNDPKIMRRIFEEDRTVAQWIHDIITGMITKIKDSYVLSTSLKDLKAVQDEYVKLMREARLKDARPDKPGMKFSTKRDSDGKLLTKEQDAFYKNSKIRDEDGNLLKVYHGTEAEFTVFDRSKGRANMDIQGNFFSPWELDSKGYGRNVKPYYLNITNPASEADAYKALNRFKGQDYAGKKATEYLMSKGYDGVRGDDELIAFYPEQIKSVDNLNPTTDPDIRFSMKRGMDDGNARLEAERKLLKEEANAKHKKYTENASEIVDAEVGETGAWVYAKDIVDKGIGRHLDIQRIVDYGFKKSAEGRKWFKEAFEDNFYKSKGEYTKSVKSQTDTLYNEVVKKRGIWKGSKESAGMQQIGEGMKLVKDGKEWKAVEYTLDDLKKDFDYTMKNGKKAWENIVEAEKVTRKMYDDYVGRINESLRKIYPNVEANVEDIYRRAMKAKLETGNLVHSISRGNQGVVQKVDGDSVTVHFKNQETGKEATVVMDRKDLMNEKHARELEDATVGKRLYPRQNYYRHFSEMQGGFLVGLDNIVNGATNIDPRLIDITRQTQPNSKFSGFLQHRGKGTDYLEDAVGGMLEYIPQAEYKINIEPNIPVLRKIIKELQEATVDSKNANDLIDNLIHVANDLAGKSNPLDRLWADYLNDKKGRIWLNRLSAVSNRVRANAVMGNMNTMIAQFFNFPNVVAYTMQNAKGTGGKGIAEGIQDALKAYAGNREAQAILNKSMFLQERYLDRSFRRFDKGIAGSADQLFSYSMELGDKIVADGAFLTFYRQNIAKGMSETDAVLKADELTRKSVAGRGIGEMPLSQKSKTVKLLMPFQVEVRNSINVLKEMGVSKDPYALAGIFVGMFGTSMLMNIALEETTGREIGLDPYGMILDAIKDEDAKSIPYRLVGNFMTNYPGGSYIADVLKEALGLDSYVMRSMFKDQDPSRFGTGNIALDTIGKPVGTALKQMSNPKDTKTNIDLLNTASMFLPKYGGKQIERTVRGLQDMALLPKENINVNSGVSLEKRKLPASYTATGKMRFPIEKTPLNYALAPTLGVYATKQGKDYITKDRRYLGEKDTAKIEQSKEPIKAYDKLIYDRDIKRIKTEIKDIKKNDEYSDAKKNKKIVEQLREQIKVIKDSGHLNEQQKRQEVLRLQGEILKYK